MIESKQITNPFPGLRPFEQDEYRLFFGREGQSDALIERLQLSHFLAVVGTSGSGKSSLVRAGLIPALRGGMMAGAGSGWRIAIMRPGSDPIGNLAHSLAEQDVMLKGDGGLPPAEAEAVIEATLRRGSLGLVEAARQARLAEHEKLLLVVDQFEELFRFRAAHVSSSSEDDAAAFVKLLLEASQQSELSIFVVPTMRSDFLGDCAQFQGLPEAINDGQYLIPRMTRDERRFAITGPVGVKRCKITEPLVNRLMNDVGDNPDQLPILQHALMRTWDYWAAHRRNGEPIGLDEYEAVGTMSDALSKHADEAYAELPDERSRQIAEVLFKSLTERGADNREIRRPTCLKDICDIANATASEVGAVIEVFRAPGCSFLMPPAGVALLPETVIDISHESLIRNWTRLQKWVDEEAQSSRTYRRLAEAAVLHREGSEGLLQDPGLQVALDWFEKNYPNAAWARRYHPEFEEAKNYLAKSTEAREAAQLERERQRNAELERERREREQAELYAAQQKRTARRLRWLVVGMALMFLFALVTAAFATKSRSDAVRARDAEITARGETEKSLGALQTAQAALQWKQKELENSVADQKKANQALQVAEDKAQTEADRARDLATQADAARKDAEAKAKLADQQRILAKQEAEQNQMRKAANDEFREAALLVQRGRYQDAKDFFSSAIEQYQNPRVDTPEAVADATVEIGNLAYAVARDTFMRTGDLRYNTLGNLRMSIGKYEEAAKIYSGTRVKQPEKAAATHFSLAMNLLKFIDEVKTKPANQNTADVQSPGWLGTEGELPNLSLNTIKLGSGPVAPESETDPIGYLNKTAAEHLRHALDYYRDFARSKDSTRAEIGRDGLRKAAYQLGELHLKKANALESQTPADPNAAAQWTAPVDNERRAAVGYFEQLLSSYQPNDVERGRLLIWLGGLNLSLSRGTWNEKTEEYFGRVVKALQQKGESEAGAFEFIANVLEENEQLAEAAAVDQRAGSADAGHNGDVKEAERYIARGQIYEKLSLNSTTPGPLVDRAAACYQYAMGLYGKLPDNVTVGQARPEKPFAVGSFYKRSGSEAAALEAFELAIKFGAPFKRDDIEIYQARAFSEKASILAGNDKPREALEAYRQALAIYDNLAKAAYGYNGSKEEADAEGDRVRVIIKALESGLNRTAPK
jgi:hypothetical protein